MALKNTGISTDIPRNLLIEAFSSICKNFEKGTLIIPVGIDGELRLLSAQPEELIEMTEKDGGATYSIIDDSSPNDGYIVATHPELGTWIESEATKEEKKKYISNFITRNKDLLLKEENMLGTWVSDDEETKNMIALDISQHVPDKELAVALGKLHNQFAIWDVRNQEEIQCGGKGFYTKPIMEKEFMPNTFTKSQKDTNPVSKNLSSSLPLNLETQLV